MKFHLIILSIFVTSTFAGVTIKEFEEEFHELWSDPNDEQAASEELAKEEASIEQHNLDYENGLSSYSEKLNELSAIPMDEFEAEKEGALENPEYATGLIEYCLRGGTGWWKYEFCYGKHVLQYHEWAAE